ncbi:MAG TPA: DUF1269 domain-containing protein [Gaiellaceae bacterium]
MSTLVVAVFDDEPTAREALSRAAELRAQGHVEIEDAVLVARHADGSVHVRETSDIATWKASAYGSAWGLVGGALVGVPVAGAALAAGYAAMIARRRDLGVSDAFEREVAERLEPGTAAVVVHARSDAAGAIARAAEGLGAWTRTVALDDLSPRSGEVGAPAPD